MAVLPSYQEIKNHYRLSPAQHHFIENARQSVKNILNGQDPRHLLIVGPCSIHDMNSAQEYALQLKDLAEKVKDHFFILMRVFFEKPRTASGWKGFLYDPHLDGSHDIRTGIRQSRQFLLELSRLGLPAATEFLDPITAGYYDDLISWGSIGARTSSSQPHRQLASGLSMAVGMKNGIAGNISAAINGVISASQPHTYMGLNTQGQPSIISTPGNTNAHIVLRGGDSGPNYDPFSVAEALRRLQQAHLMPNLLIDCSHQNSGKRHDRQPFVFQSILDQILNGNTSIKGMLIESHLNSGNQSLKGGLSGGLAYGVSITDSCLDWSSTEHLILQGAALINQNQTLENDDNNTFSRFSCAVAHS